MKNVGDLSIADFREHPVWEFTNEDLDGDFAVRPVRRVPVNSLEGRIVGTQVRLADGTRVWAMLSNVDVTNPEGTRHYLTIGLQRNGRWFPMARYHDPDWDTTGAPHAVASFLGKNIDDVFPISYDLRAIALGDTASLVGTVEANPKPRLTRRELIARAVPRKAPRSS
jgi:hypothetical protein